MYDEGRPWYGDDGFNKLAKEQQDQRAPEDSMADDIIRACEEVLLSISSDGVSVSVREVLDKMDIPKRDRKSEGANIGRVLSRAGWRVSRPGDGATRVRRYRKPDQASGQA